MHRLLTLLVAFSALPLAAHCPPRWPPRWHHRHRPIVLVEPAPWIRPYARAWVPRPWCPRVVYWP